MDAQNPSFEGNTYDIIVSRNLTWVLPNPQKAYQNWVNLLNPGGLLLNFDANWYGHLFDADKRKEYELDRMKVAEHGAEDHYLGTNFKWYTRRPVPLY